jgi:RimJ/RimL family protein N-acetyltransferase
MLHGPPGARHSAEIAFAVEEDYQGQGMASRILRHLARIAREQGLAEFTAEVLPRNRAMLAVFARSGLPVKSAVEDDTVHVTLALK